MRRHRRQRVAGFETHAESIQQLLVVRRPGIWRRQQPIAEEHRVRAGNETQRLRFVTQRQAAGAESLRAIAAGLEARGIPATRGGNWSAVQVSRLLERIGGAGRPFEDASAAAA